MVQAWTLRNSGFGLWKTVPIWKIVTAVGGSSLACVGVKYLCNGSLSLEGTVFWFVVLALTACVFFGIYAVLLLVMKENLFIEMIGNILNKVKKK